MARRQKGGCGSYNHPQVTTRWISPQEGIFLRNVTVLQVIIAVLVIALIALTFAHIGGRDGNPIGFDFAGQPGQMPASTTTTKGCLESTTCQSAEIHYLKLPPAPCPTSLLGTKLCTTGANPVRTVPTCATGEQCITLQTTTQGGTASIQDNDPPRSYSNTSAKVEIILK
jgi:hypothetical protein